MTLAFDSIITRPNQLAARAGNPRMANSATKCKGDFTRRWRRVFAGCLTCVLCCHFASAQDPKRIIDQKPFDRLVLKKNDQVLKLEPLELKPRRPLINQQPDFKLRVQIYGKRQRYEVAWSDVKQVTLFEQMLLLEAAKLRDAGQFEDAYEYYVFLELGDAKFPGVNEAFAACLFREADAWINRRRWDLALSLLNEAHRRDPKIEGLAEALSKTTDTLVGDHFVARRYPAARRLAEQLAGKYPQHPVVKKWVDHLAKSATDSQRAARAAMNAGKFPTAYLAAKQSIELWPNLTGSKQLLDELQSKYPMLTVGVLSTATTASDQDRLALTWAARRSRRLLNRRLIEPVAATDAGMRYESSLAALQFTDEGLTLKLNSKTNWLPDGEPLRGVDVARRLLAASQAGQADYHPHWAAILRGLQVVDERQVNVRLKWKHPRPRGLLRVTLLPWHTPLSMREDAATLGPYRVVGRAGREVRHLRNDGYFAQEEGQAAELIERRFANSAGALGPLNRGEIAALDRIHPWDVTRFQSQKNVSVAAYAVPTVHLLIPNRNHPLPADAMFRRAVAQGIQRQRILDGVLLQAADPRRGRLAFSPFPQGSEAPSIQPLAYDPRTMAAVMRLRQAQLKKAEANAAANRLHIRLSHPPTALARRACREIKQHLELGGRGPSVELLESKSAPPRDGDWDFRYFEWSMCDPLIDAPLLFRRIGAEPRVQEALMRLARLQDPQQVAAEFQKLERLIHEQQTVVPLWQLTEHYALHRSLRGAGEGLCNLYQNVESWRRQTDTAP